ncbi:MAG: S8 family serine peptidase [Ignavibacteria bacterium]|nr:S8 family serine peptidase [Ignavibacteria bacterium]
MGKESFKILSIFYILLISFSNGFPQTDRVVIKLSVDAPPNTLNNFRTGNYKGDKSGIGDVLDNSGAKDFKPFINNELLRKFTKSEIEIIGLERIFIFKSEQRTINLLIGRLKFNKYIEYVQKLGILNLENSEKVYIIPNDPYFSSQYYLSNAGFNSVWDFSLGDSSVVIGVIDSGLDFTHPDLQNSYKINYGEFGNGKENNGIDDDNNGFIDDWRGWNFISNSNNPSDDNINSHGTAVTGIINAGFDNGIGISSAASNTKVLVLKAFDKNGTGAEDIVSYAVLYGISAGVKIFNFSFGDNIYSNLFRDVARFAYSKNITIVTSAGNTASDNLHYPSAFDEVISVGAIDANNFRTGFSTFGETVDIFAPGNQILTTSRTGKGLEQLNLDYFYINGTSFSAPIVSSAAAILLSKNKNLTNEEIRGILVSNTDYIKNQTGWDHYSASGKLNILSAYNNIDNPAIARIYLPYQNFSSYDNSVPLVISSAYPFTKSTIISYSYGENFLYPFNIFSSGSNQFIKDTVLNWNIESLPDTTYTLRLIIDTYSGRTIEHGLIFYKDSKTPEISSVSALYNVADSNNISNIITFITNKPTVGKIFFKRKNITEPYQYIFADLGYENIGYVSNVHFGLLKGKNLYPNTAYEYYIEAEALNKKRITHSEPNFIFTAANEINSYGYTSGQYALPLSQILDTLVDINGNGLKEFFVTDVNNNLKLNVYEFNGQNFIKISDNNWEDFVTAKDIGDVTGNGKINLLTSKGRNGILFESPVSNALPVKKVWSDEVGDNFWSASISDIDNDGLKELTGYGRTGLRILEYNGSQFVEIAVLPYSTITSEPNSQKILIDDFDNDGKNEIIFTDLHFTENYAVSTLNVFRCNSDNNFTKVTSADIEGVTFKAECLTYGDFDNDGKKEIAFGTGSDNDLPDILYVSFFKLNPGGNLILTNRIVIRNYSPLSNTSIKSYSISGPVKNMLAVNTGNIFYIYQYSGTEYEPVYYKSGINSYSQGIFDLNNNGINEIGLNFSGDSLRFLEKETILSQTPSPTGLKGYSLDSNIVLITFNTVSNSNYYKIYRSTDSTNFNTYDIIFSNIYYDTDVNNGQYYFYKITATDTSLQIKESIPCGPLKIFVHNKTKPVSAESEGSYSASVKFSNIISYGSPSPSSVIINDTINPDFISYKNNTEYLLTFGQKLKNGLYKIKTRNLVDGYGSPIDTTEILLYINIKDSIIFYITSAKLITKDKIRVDFNLGVDSSTSVNSDNYSLEPFNLKIAKSEFNPQDLKSVILTISGGTPGASGKNYILRVVNVKSENGILITPGAGSSFGLVFSSETLENVVTYPNPYIKKNGQGYITFANLTPVATIYIYDISGKFIREIKETDGNGGVEWDLRDSNGNEAGSGIYIFRATGKNSNGVDVGDKIGKFAIVK